MQNPVPNAYTLAIGGRKPFVVVHTALLELLEPLEVQVGAPLHNGKACDRIMYHKPPPGKVVRSLVLFPHCPSQVYKEQH